MLKPPSSQSSLRRRAWLQRAAALGVALPIAASAQASGSVEVQPGSRAFEFIWSGLRLGDRVDPHGAMIVPIRWPGIDRQLYMQFDLGAPSSVLYAPKLQSLRERLPELGWDGGERLAALNLRMAETRASFRNIRVSEAKTTKPIRWDDETSKEVVGTFGADLIAGWVLGIDYAKRLLKLWPAPGPAFESNPWFAFSFSQRRIVFEAELQGETKKIIFDTGSSAFELLTDDSTFKRLARPGAPVEQSQVKSWDNMVSTFSVPTDAKLKIGRSEVPLVRVTRVEGVTLLQRLAMQALGIGGMTGNKLFLNHILVVDTQGLRMALVDPAQLDISTP